VRRRQEDKRQRAEHRHGAGPESSDHPYHGGRFSRTRQGCAIVAIRPGPANQWLRSPDRVTSAARDV
jgi:hypothetical protein